jgi:hypothetical protein
MRWVTADTDDAWQWDAFLAPSGTPLPHLAGGKPRLGWGEARLILDDLTQELEAACADGTLPKSLTVDQVWVQPDGRVQLLAMSLVGIHPTEAPAAGPQVDQKRSLHFLREVAVTALEGAIRPVADVGDGVRAPLPAHAADLLGRLFDPETPYATVAELRQELEQTRDRPAEVSRTRRFIHLSMTALFLQIAPGGVVLVLLVTFLGVQGHWLWSARQEIEPPPWEFDLFALAVIVLNVGFWVVWAFSTRGGYVFWRGGIVLRRADGSKATRPQCAFRALLVWTPIAALLCLALAVAYEAPDLPEVYFAIWGVGALLLPVFGALAILFPRQSLHDRIAGTYLMPE